MAPALQKQPEGLTLWMALVLQKKMVRFWFQRCPSGNFNLHNKPREPPEAKVNIEELKDIVEVDPSQTSWLTALQTMMEQLAAK